MAIKVAQVIPRVGCESSGPTYYMNNLIRRLEEVGCDVELFSLEKFCHLNLFNLGVSREMYGALKAKVPTMDIIHNNSLWMMPNLYAYWAAKDSACKVVTSPHGTLSQWALRHGKVKKIVFGNLFQYPALSRTDMFHATCVKEYDEIRSAGFFQPVAIIPIGITVGDHKGNRTGVVEKQYFWVDCIKSKLLIIWFWHGL